MKHSCKEKNGFLLLCYEEQCIYNAKKIKC